MKIHINKKNLVYAETIIIFFKLCILKLIIPIYLWNIGSTNATTTNCAHGKFRRRIVNIFLYFKIKGVM